MHSAVVLAVSKVLAERAGDRIASLRFDYRGVGTSEGSYDEGRGETLDVRAAIDFVREHVPGKPITVCGYSFGTWVGLRAASLEHAHGDIDRVVLIAPAVRVFEFVEQDAAHLRRLRRLLGRRLLLLPRAHVVAPTQGELDRHAGVRAGAARGQGGEHIQARLPFLGAPKTGAG